MNKDAFYFPHFCNARHDRKIRRVRKELGLEGYGIFFMLLEVLREQADYKYPIEDMDLLADEFGTDKESLDFVIYYSGLFITNDYYFSYLFKNNGKIIKPKNKRKRMYNTNVIEWYKLIKIVFDRDNYTCYYCGKVGGKIEADHKIPWSKGGKDTLENLVTACRKCNRQKKDKTDIEFIEWRENNG